MAQSKFRGFSHENNMVDLSIVFFVKVYQAGYIYIIKSYVTHDARVGDSSDWPASQIRRMPGKWQRAN